MLDSHVADRVTSILRGVINGPDPLRTGINASIGRPAAGKTGTTENFGAAWFCGYTPSLAGAAWIGDPRGTAYPLRDVTLGGRRYAHVFGGDVPARIWAAGMSGALPVGLQLIGRPFDEATLFSAARALERETPPLPAPKAV